MQWRPVRKQATCDRGIGFAKCAQVAGSSTLGKLGRYHENGVGTPS